MIHERIREISPESRRKNHDSRGSSGDFMGFMHSYARKMEISWDLSERTMMIQGRIMVMNHGIFARSLFTSGDFRKVFFHGIFMDLHGMFISLSC